jgi:hypothetical protein
MSEIKYDPELPFAFISTANREVARFADREIAARFGKEVMVGRVVDTTPKPKIPEDAEFVTWRGDRNSILEFAEKTQGYWSWSGLEISEIALTEVIGDAEVTVLVRKEET